LVASWTGRKELLSVKIHKVYVAEPRQTYYGRTFRNTNINQVIVSGDYRVDNTMTYHTMLSATRAFYVTSEEWVMLKLSGHLEDTMTLLLNGVIYVLE